MGLLPSGELAGIVAEFLTPGPDLAGWLTLTDPGRLEDYALAGVAVAWRRLAAWATAGELAAVGQMAARVAARDSKVGLGEDGRPTRVTAEAATEIALAEAMSQSMASWWADLAVSLSWRLPAVGAALWAGQIDLGRARKIAEATRCLSEQKAREVAAAILPEAGDLTMGELTARLRRAVLAADPEGADERRSQAEAEAKVVLHPDDEGTATLAGYNLPAIQAAAAMARITAMAKACKAAGQGGGIDRLRAQVMLGLLLGTLGHIPPADGAPDEPPSDGGDPDGGDPEDSAPGEPPSDGGDPGNDAPPPDDRDAPPPDGYDGDDGPIPEDPEAPAGYADDGLDDGGIVPAWPGLPSAIGPGGAAIPPALARCRAQRPDRPVPGLLDLTVPWRTLAGLAVLPGKVGRLGPVTPAIARQLAEVAAGDLAAAWRVIVTDSDGHAIAVARVPHPRCMAGQADGFDSPAGAGTGPGAPRGVGLVGRVTLTLGRDMVIPPGRTGAEAGGAGGPPSPPSPPSDRLAMMLAVAWRAAAKAADRAEKIAAADAVAGGCAHTEESPHYRPPPRLREYIVARDVTCRIPTCRQPAWQADLDHTIPHDKGGRTCKCDLGGGCRTHHQVKQRPGWQLTQDRPGHFRWVTPAGRTYVTGPDAHLV